MNQRLWMLVTKQEKEIEDFEDEKEEEIANKEEDEENKDHCFLCVIF